MKEVYIHTSAEVSKEARIGKKTKIWNNAQIRENAVIGEECIIGKNVYIDKEVKVGNKVKLQNNVSVYRGVTIEDGVFIGPNVCLTNAKVPRAVTVDGMLRTDDDWELGHINVGYGASIGASAVIVTNVRIGKFAMIGAGSVVTKSVPDHGLVIGNPSRLKGFVCKCGYKLKYISKDKSHVNMECTECSCKVGIPVKDYAILN